MNAKTFQSIMRIAALLIALSILSNLWAVWRNRELSRSLASTTPQFQAKAQELLARQQGMKNLLQEIRLRSGNDPKVIAILQRHNLVTAK